MGAQPCRRQLDLAYPWIDVGVELGRARLISGDRVLWSHWRFENGDASWGTLASVGARCQATTRYILIDDFSESMTVQGTTLVRATDGRLTSESLITVPPPLWPIGNPFDWSDNLYD